MSKKAPYSNKIQQALNFNIATVRDNEDATKYQIENLETAMQLEGGKNKQNYQKVVGAMHENLEAIDKRIAEAEKKVTSKKGFFAKLWNAFFGPSEEQKVANANAVRDFQKEKQDMLNFYEKASSKLFAGIAEQKLTADDLVPASYNMPSVKQAIEKVAVNIYDDPKKGERLRTERAPSPSQTSVQEEGIYEEPVTLNPDYVTSVSAQDQYYAVPMENSNEQAVFKVGGASNTYEYYPDNKSRSVTGEDNYETPLSQSSRASSRDSLEDVPGYATSADLGYQSGPASRADSPKVNVPAGLYSIGGISGETQDDAAYDTPRPQDQTYAVVRPTAERSGQQGQDADAPKLPPKLPPRAASSQGAKPEEIYEYAHAKPQPAQRPEAWRRHLANHSDGNKTVSDRIR